MKRYFIYSFVILVVVAAIAGYFIYRDFQFHTNRPYMNYKKSVTVKIKRGKSVSDIGKLLYLRGVVSSSSYFRTYYKRY